jgi:hypothetical protein
MQTYQMNRDRDQLRRSEQWSEIPKEGVRPMPKDC